MEHGAAPRSVWPSQALTEDDEEPDHKSHDGEDQPPVADGVIVWGGGEPGGVSPARARSTEPTAECRGHRAHGKIGRAHV